MAIFLAISTSYAAVGPNNTSTNISINESNTIQDALDYLDPNSSGNGTIYLNNSSNGVYSGVGNVNLTISSNRNITIIGNPRSATGTIINGSDVNWGLNINSNGYVTLINLTISNFYKNNHGGAIYASGTLTLIDCTF